MRQRYYKQKRKKKLFVVHQRGNAYEKEIFENMYQCFGSNGSLANGDDNLGTDRLNKINIVNRIIWF